MSFSILDVAVLEGSNGPPIVEGTLEGGNHSSLYQFSGTAGQAVYFDTLIEPGQASGSWNLYGPGNQHLTGTSVTSDFERVLPVDGAYHLVLSSHSASGFDYSFRLFDTTANAVPLDGLESSYAGTITAGSVDSSTFTAPAGQLLYFDGLSGQNLTVQLRSPSNETVLWAGPSSDSGPFVLPLSGMYTLTVQGNSPTSAGDYAFRLLAMPDDAEPLALGSEVSGSISVSWETELYTFSATVGQRLYFDGISGPSDNYISLHNLTAQTQQGYFSSVRDDSGPFTIAQTGTYALIVAGGSGTGDYAFRLFDLADATPLGVGDTVAGALDPGRLTNLYAFEGQAGQRLYFDSLAASNYYGAAWWLFGPNSQYVGGSSWIGSDFEVVLPTDGTYVLVVRGQQDAALTYEFRALLTSESVAPLSLGATVAGTLAQPGDTASYTFEGTVGQQLYYDGLAGASGITARLVDPLGNTVSPIWGSSVVSDAGPLTLTRSGTYRLVIDGSGDATGDYAFRLLDLAESDAAQVGPHKVVVPVLLGEAHASTVSVQFVTAPDTAIPGEDYVPRSGTISFAPGVTMREIVIPIVGDTIPEDNETFFVDLSNPVNSTITRGRATVTILDDDEQIEIAINDVIQFEGNEGLTPFVFTVTLSAASSEPVTLSYQTNDGTAVAGVDYQAASGTL